MRLRISVILAEFPILKKWPAHSCFPYTSDDIANSGLYGGGGSPYIVRVSGSSGDQRGSPAIGPAAPNPTTPRTTGAKIGVRITPTVAPATPKTRGRISKCDRL